MLFHETLFQDVRACLTEYESISEFSSNSVDWDRFDALAADKAKQVELLGRLAFNKAPGRTTVTHAPCEQMFPAGGEMEAFIRESDPWLFEKFGYSGCCTRSAHPSSSTPPQ
jgi:hypothetical protein